MQAQHSLRTSQCSKRGGIYHGMKTWVTVAWLILVATASMPAAFTDSGAEVYYVGGTVEAITKGSSGRLLLTNNDRLLLRLKRLTVSIPWTNVNLLEYGQSVDRRIAESILISPLFLLSKKRKHYLTIGFEDQEGRQHALVFQTGSGDIRALLAGLEARTGLKVVYQDEEARKSGKGQ